MVMAKNDKVAEILSAIRSYKVLTESNANHPGLLKDKTIVLYVSTLLDMENIDVLEICLDILQNLIDNEENHSELVGTFGIFEALESLVIRTRHTDADISTRAGTLIEILRKTGPPAYRTRSKNKNPTHIASNTGGASTTRTRPTKLYQVYINSMSKNNARHIEKSLTEIKGLISFVMDIECKKITLRVLTKLSLETIAKYLDENCKVRIKAIVKNTAENKEEYIDILDRSMNISLNYFPEDDNIHCSFGTLATNINNNLTNQSTGWIKSAATFLNKNLYW